MAGVLDSPARAAALAIVSLGLWVTAPREIEAQSLTPVRRSEMIDVARKMAEFQWVPSARNLVAACVTNYRTPWRSGEAETGVAYDWGGMDSIEIFRKRLASGEAAGSHKAEGSTRCTAGVDCSGLVSLAWRLPRKFSTSDIATVSTPL